jgi:phage tail-like protein
MTPMSYLPPIPQPPHDPKSWLLNGRVGWKMATLLGVESRPRDGSLVLAPLAGSGRSVTESSGSFGGLRPPANVAFAPDGTIYLLDLHDLQLKRFDPCAFGFVVVTCFHQKSFLDPHGIAICGGDLFVCDTGHHRLLVFSLDRLTLRAAWEPPAATKLANPWLPYDISFDGNGRAFVTDPANGFVHRFSPLGHWETGFAGFGAATFLAVDCRDCVHVVSAGAARVVTIDTDGKPIVSAGGASGRPDFLAASFPPPPFPVDAAGNLHLRALLPEECVAAPATAAKGRTQPEPGVFDLDGNPVAPLAVPPPAMSAFPVPVPPAPSGACISAALDSKLYRCQWHRVLLTGLVPQGTRVIVATYTSEALLTDDQVALLPEESWQTQQTVGQMSGDWDCLIRSGGGRYLWLRLRFYSGGPSTPVIERLIVEYPRISLRRYLPAVFGAEPVSADFTDRFLSLFDTVFRSIEREIDTVARFFDPMATPAVRDPKNGVDFLSWLAGWIGVSLDRSWPVHKQRLFLKRAGRLFNIRGTREGLRRALLLYLDMEAADDPCTEAVPDACCPPPSLNCAPPRPRRRWQPPPLILEHFRLRRWLMVGQGRLGDDAVLWGQSIVNRSQLDNNAQLGGTKLLTEQDPYRDPFYVYANKFTVFVPARFGRSAQDRKSLLNLIATESPAHTLGQVNYVEPRFRIGIQSTIGLDAVIARVPEGVTLDQTALDGSRALTGPPGAPATPAFEIGMQGRIGSSTVA